MRIAVLVLTAFLSIQALVTAPAFGAGAPTPAPPGARGGFSIAAAGPCRGASPRALHQAALLAGEKGRRLEELDRQRACLLLEAAVEPRAEFAPQDTGDPAPTRLLVHATGALEPLCAPVGGRSAEVRSSPWLDDPASRLGPAR